MCYNPFPAIDDISCPIYWFSPEEAVHDYVPRAGGTVELSVARLRLAKRGSASDNRAEWLTTNRPPPP